MTRRGTYYRGGLSAALALFTLIAPTTAPAQEVAKGKVDLDEATGRDVRYNTQDAMYLANEEWLLYACELPAGQTDIGSDFNNDSYWYSRYNLGNLLFRSGMGIHMVHNPLFKKHAVEDKKPDGTAMFPTPKDFMKFKIRQFCARTGVPCRFDAGNMENPKAFPPKGAFPIFLEFASGSPRFTQPPVPGDFTTLRWDPASMDRTIMLGAVGQTLLKQVLWAEDFFAYHRKGPNGEQWFGNDKEYGNGFRGAALTAQCITKMFTLKSALVYDPKTGKFGGIDPATYDPMQGLRYHPHAIRANLAMKPGMPPMPTKWEVVDRSSHLADQASLLWGASEFYFYSDPTVKDSFDGVFGDQGDHKTKGAMFPAVPHKLSKGLSVVAFKNMMALHFDKANGTFHGVAEPGKKSGTIATADAGVALAALANAQKRLHDGPPPLLAGIKMAIAAQGSFLRDKLQGADGGFHASYVIGKGPSGGKKQLLSQGLGIRGLLAAYSATGDASFKSAAEKGYAYMNNTLWHHGAGTYRSEVGAKVSSYTPRSVGATLGALRELALLRSGDERKSVVKRIDAFFAATQTQRRQQLAEIDPTGEPIPAMAEMMKMKAQLKAVMAKDPARGKAMMMKMADVDGDGVPKPGMAGGDFGFAPVPAALIKVDTP